MKDDFKDDFYEEDEPIEKIRRILKRPPDFVTQPPSMRRQFDFSAEDGSELRWVDFAAAKEDGNDQSW